MKDSIIFSLLLVIGLLSQTVEGFRPSLLSASSSAVKVTQGRKLQSAFVHLPSSSSTTTTLFQSSDSDDTPKRRRKRVKRKETAAVEVEVEVEEEDEDDYEDEDEEEEEVAAVVKEPRGEDVRFQVRDVRDLVGGYKSSKAASASTTMASSNTASSSSAKQSTSAPSSSSSSSNDSLEMMLLDAKEMQVLEDKESKEKEVEETEGFSVPTTLKKAISTVVTADFFLVCAFLVWFLAGIFCSSVLKDDTVQIAFNLSFQPYVQPALGFLMIATIAGGMSGDEEEMQ